MNAPIGKGSISQRIIFIDRDGVITKERKDYVKNVDELEILSGVPEDLARLNRNGFNLIVVTNQSVVNRGLLTHEGLYEIHQRMLCELSKRGCTIQAIYYCPHRPDEHCDCRKPSPSMLFKAAEEFNIDLADSWMIGDNDMDVQAGKQAGCKAFKVQTNEALSLSKAVSHILHAEGKIGLDSD